MMKKITENDEIEESWKMIVLKIMQVGSKQMVGSFRFYKGSQAS